jgi:hypothetical protein
MSQKNATKRKKLLAMALRKNLRRRKQPQKKPLKITKKQGNREE